MKISRKSVGLAVLAAREAAGLTLHDLSGMTGLTTSSLSRTERGERDLSFTESIEIAEAAKIDYEAFRSLAEAFERAGATETSDKMSELERDLHELRKLAIEATIEARASA